MTIAVELGTDRLTVTLTDNGRPFNPLDTAAAIYRKVSRKAILSPSGDQDDTYGDSRAGISCSGWTQSFARTRVRPERDRMLVSGVKP